MECAFIVAELDHLWKLEGKNTEGTRAFNPFLLSPQLYTFDLYGVFTTTGRNLTSPSPGKIQYLFLKNSQIQLTWKGARGGSKLSKTGLSFLWHLPYGTSFNERWDWPVPCQGFRDSWNLSYSGRHPLIIFNEIYLLSCVCVLLTVVFFFQCSPMLVHPAINLLELGGWNMLLGKCI